MFTVRVCARQALGAALQSFVDALMGWREAVQGDASSPLKYALKIVEPIIDPLAFLMVAYLQVQ